ncbi:MAG: hypothetical protein HQL34_03760 [Alphaproteobacteria bacterium]|nr:hypothetical protein [Alphaproteobacteria bacterium]
MANAIVDFLLSLVMSKKARENLDAYRETSRATNALKERNTALSSREQAIATMKSSGQGLVTEDRAELIRRAMEIRKAKQSLLANLDDEQRQKLMALAIKKLMHDDTPPKE